jgi:hypothetical protein
MEPNPYESPRSVAKAHQDIPNGGEPRSVFDAALLGVLIMLGSIVLLLGVLVILGNITARLLPNQS